MTALHHMIDLETIDTAPTAGILSIGIVAFNPDTGELGPTLYRRLGYDQARMYGTESASTIEWWQRQNPATRAEAFTAEHDATIAAFEVVEFIRHTAGVWGNGATFDITITEHWLNVLGVGVPYRYGMSRDCRTVEELARYIGITRKQFIRRGDHHNALDDAIYQAEYISGMWRGLTVRPVVQLPEVDTIQMSPNPDVTPYQAYEFDAMRSALTAAGVPFRPFRRHDFVRTGDADSFPAIQDTHGDVVLSYCRVCKRGESELSASCTGAS